MCKCVCISSPPVWTALNPRRSSRRDQHSPSLPFMEETEAPEAKQEAEKLRFTEPRSEWEFPQTLLTLILLFLFPLYGDGN